MYCDGFSSIVICIMEVTLSEVIWLLLYFEHTVHSEQGLAHLRKLLVAVSFLHLLRVTPHLC